MEDENPRGVNIHEELEKHQKNMEKIKKDVQDIVSKQKFSTILQSKKIILPTDDKGPRRVRTGINGFDDLIEGGIPDKSLVLLTGKCGTGKSIFSMQFLIEGAINGEPGVYVSLQESMEETMAQMKFFGWPVEKLMEEGKLLIVEPELYNFDSLLTTIEDSIEKVKAKRLVVDSISIIGMYFEQPFKIRKALLDLGNMLKKLGCTTIATSEIGEGENQLSPFGVEEFVADSVIILYYVKRGTNFLRAITVRKMRTTRHSTKIHPFEIRRPGGAFIYSTEEFFAEM